MVGKCTQGEDLYKQARSCITCNGSLMSKLVGLFFYIAQLQGAFTCDNEAVKKPDLGLGVDLALVQAGIVGAQ